MSGRAGGGLRWAAVAALTLASLELASCSEYYLARRDTLSPGSGDAVDAAIAKQAIDPWSPDSRIGSLDFNGQRIEHAMELYRNPSSGVPAGLPVVPVAPGVGTAAVR